MHKPLSQLPLDFSGEEGKPSPPSDGNGNGNGDGDHRDGQYLATAGVGVRVKSFKKPAATPAGDNETLFQAVPDGGGDPAAAEITAVDETTAAAEVTAVDETTAVAEVTAVDEHTAVGEPTALTRRPRRDSASATPRPTPARAKAALKTSPSKRGRKSLKQVTAEADLIEIPADEVLFGKQYYTMGEVSVMFKVNQSLLRYWETEFDILQPRKNKKGDRYFRPVDIKNLHLIYHLLRQKKYTIEGAKEFLRNNKKARERFEVIERLQQIRSFLLEWKAQL
jgi:DNA-binding transcriptional MerR regulator